MMFAFGQSAEREPARPEYIAAAALWCAWGAQWLVKPTNELPSEVLGWVILAGVFTATKGTKRFAPIKADGLPGDGKHDGEPTSTQKVTLWVVAFCISITAFSTTEFMTVGFMPALTPILATGLLKLGDEDRSSQSRLMACPKAMAAVALLTCYTLCGGDYFRALPSLLPLAASAIMYLALSPRAMSKWLAPVDTEEHSQELSWRAAVLNLVAMGVHGYFLGSRWPGVMSVVPLGFLKALTWYYLIKAANRSSWLVAAPIKIFALTTDVRLSALSSSLMAFLYPLTSLLTLAQLVDILPSEGKPRRKSPVWSLLIVPLCPLILNMCHIWQFRQDRPTWSASQPHPVESFFKIGKSDFKALLASQSRNYTAAHQEYTRRYGMEPPPGFEKWYHYAVKHDSLIIDNYDAIIGSIKPFFSLSGADVRLMMESSRETKWNELWTCAFAGPKTEMQCSHEWRARTEDRDISTLFGELLGEVAEELKGVNVLVNHLDEPRVLYGPHARGRSYSHRNFAMRSPWNALTKFCPIVDEVASKSANKYFAPSKRAVMDICKHDEYENQHGLFVSPTSLRLVEGLVPVLSTGVLSQMRDILIPSPAYIQSRFQYEDESDPAWEKKANNLYWDGSSTGGVATKQNQWLSFHRQRFVALAQGLLPGPFTYFRQTPAGAQRILSPFINGRLYNVAFTNIFQCTTPQCFLQRAFFKTRSWTSPTAALSSRLVFDLDGNGISGRFYRLLASRSTPLKQTLLREWHDERLVPWVHYIPVSMGMEELPELVEYLTQTEQGQKRARQVAEQGREWVKRGLREADMGVYLYRLLLELRRLQDVDREAWAS